MRSVATAARRRPSAATVCRTPHHLATSDLVASGRTALAVQLEGTTSVRCTATISLNTVAISADGGQRGRIGGHATWNLTVNYRASGELAWFVGVKNLADRLYVADLSRGIVAGPPRQLQAGFEYRF
jgi:outer membrane receptor protein involved in Fe transport